MLIKDLEPFLRVGRLARAVGLPCKRIDPDAKAIVSLEASKAERRRRLRGAG